MCDKCQEIIDLIEKEFGHKVDIHDFIKLVEESPLEEIKCKQCERIIINRSFATLHGLHQDMSLYDVDFCTIECLETWLRERKKRKQVSEMKEKHSCWTCDMRGETDKDGYGCRYLVKNQSIELLRKNRHCDGWKERTK